MSLMVSDSAATLPWLALIDTGTVPIHPEGLAAEESGQSAVRDLDAGAAGTTTAALDLDATTLLTVIPMPPDDPGVHTRQPGPRPRFIAPCQIEPIHGPSRPEQRLHVTAAREIQLWFLHNLP